jgi:hypothetical protein
MRSKMICQGFAVTANSTSSSTPILLIAGGHFVNYGDSNVPGEDMAFPSSGAAVVALVLSDVVLSAGDTIAVQVSQNYFADSGSGETFANAKNGVFTATTAFPGATAGLDSTTIFLDNVSLGEAVRVTVTSSITAGAGAVSAYLLSN